MILFFMRPSSHPPCAIRLLRGRKLVGYLLTIVAASALSQEVKYVPTARDFRVVTGQLYNIERSKLWKDCAGECVMVLTNGVIIQEYKIHRITAPGGSVSYNQSVGAYAPIIPRRVISEERILGQKFFLRNYPKDLMPTTGKDIKALGMRVGTFQYGLDTLECWDYGTPNTPPKPKTEK